ncbi:uncharacterized protein [Eleutherodactylus coqui]|uniref:uncharacterized protein n=1 Tax=Eleutherodactylus coqui TaxID=57060 RepID=UPI0034620281
MEDLMERIKDVMASQGTSWLVKMAEELSRPPAVEAGESSSQPVLPSSEEPRGRHVRSQPVLPSSEEPRGRHVRSQPVLPSSEEPRGRHDQSQPVLPSSEKPRGRPVRRRNPPARLSPSPVVKRAVPMRSPRTEGARRSGAVRSQRDMAEAEPVGRIRVSDGEVEVRDGLTCGVAARSGSDSGEGARLSRSGDGVSAYGAAKIRSPSGRGVTSGDCRERHAAHRPYSQSALPAPNFPLAMPEDNEADVDIQGAAPNGGGRGVTDWSVWVIGHSYIYWAERRARNRPIGGNLGLNIPVHWQGIRGLQWPRLLQEVLRISSWENDKVILVIHAGGNDLGKIKVAELISLMKEDIYRFKQFFKRMIIVWSDIVARRIWREARDNEAIERVRRTVNFRISKHVQALGGIAIRHWELERRERGMMRGDGVHLSEIGLDIFLSRLQDGVESALLLACGGRSAA